MGRSRKNVLLAAGAGIAGVLLARHAMRRGRHFSFDDRVVLVTGGSRGLGLVMARKLVGMKAKVAICARNEVELLKASRELKAIGGDILAISCDVRDDGQVQKCVRQIVAHWGRLDILFNVAGIIEVGPVEAMSLDDFRNSMAVNCWGALHTTLAALPHMRRQQWGRIVNVASLGGKRAIPHMVPYDTSKFALVGLSTGLRTELAKDGVLVTVVCPGLMRTGSPRNATFKGNHKQEYAWFSVSDSLPGISMNASDAADEVLKAAQSGDAEVVISGLGKLATLAQTIAPNLMSEAAILANRLLPGMPAGGRISRKGFESQSWISPSLLTSLGEKAARDNNEVT